jgi:hypothetical protein
MEATLFAAFRWSASPGFSLGASVASEGPVAPGLVFAPRVDVSA